jgi:hypothetical protein
MPFSGFPLASTEKSAFHFFHPYPGRISLAPLLRNKRATCCKKIVISISTIYHFANQKHQPFFSTNAELLLFCGIWQVKGHKGRELPGNDGNKTPFAGSGSETKKRGDTAVGERRPFGHIFASRPGNSRKEEMA